MSKKAVDMLHGSVMKKMLAFAIPMVLTSWLQTFFSSADSMIVGRWGSEGALASVGATFVFVMLIISFFGGLSAGVTVCAATDWGAGDRKGFDDTAHTAVLLSALVGLFIMVLGEIIAAPVLTAMDVPEDIRPGAILYLRLYMLCMPFQMVYNSGASIMRSRGDSKTPLMFLMISGASNVVLNILFVVAFKWNVAGVAIATVLTQALSAALVLTALFKKNSEYGLSFSRLKLHGEKVKNIVIIGLPAGLQAAMLAASDIPLQTCVNSLGSLAVAGNAAALNLDSITFMTMEAIGQSCTVFTGQCIGAGDHKRARKVLWNSMILIVASGAVIGWICVLFKTPLVSLFQPDSPEAVAWGVQRVMAVCSLAFVYGILATLNSSLRGHGISTPQAIINGIGLFGFRVMWSLVVFPRLPDLFHLYLSYPVAWTFCIIAMAIIYNPMIKRQLKKKEQQKLSGNA